jgi:predicted DNA binding CopG/RHH family protein
MTKNKNPIILTEEELIIEAEFARGEVVSVLQAIARNTLAKSKTLTVRVSERNLLRLKAAAAREGVPYQTLITSLIQKHI